MNNKWLFFFTIMIILPIVSSSSFYIPQNSNYSINFNCQIDGAVCTDSANCNISIDYPNSTTLIDNQMATLISNSRFNYSLNQNETAVAGDDYRLNIVCYDGDFNGSSSPKFGINPSGVSPSQERTDTITRSVYFIFIIGVLLFIGFLFKNQSISVKWTFFIFSIIFFLIGINIIFISLQDQMVNEKLVSFFSTFTTISWYFYWFAAGLLIIIWILTFFNTMILKKNLSNARRYGIA